MKTLMEIYKEALKGMDSIFIARENGDIDALNEASLGRVYQHVMNAKTVKLDKSWSIMTSFRREKSMGDNRKTNKEMEHTIRSWGYGFFDVKGHGQEEDKETGETVVATEDCFFIVGITKERAKQLGSKYKQDFILYSGPDTNGNVVVISLNTGKEDDLGPFHPMKISKFYSTVKGKPFVFEYVMNSPQDKLAEIIWNKRKTQ